ncbi:hypothetical protein LTR97_001531 [Elasticomyces elasticus]|uniref:Uncharacterized protein n=1 Tax=Elasticomyces elasticus TaxID=574655 RepID=A0AAN8A555_9PEZI|nr:hypothetical protein LTR97_001531 [Elasticomyces elasticus]
MDRPSFFSKIPQQAAVERSKDGLCGDAAHPGECKITECTAGKALVIYKDDASFSIVHANSILGTGEGHQRDGPVVQKACEGSKKMLKQLLEKERADVAAAQEMTRKANAQETKAQETEAEEAKAEIMHTTTGTVSQPHPTIAKQAKKMAPASMVCGALENSFIGPVTESATVVQDAANQMEVETQVATIASEAGWQLVDSMDE